MRKFYTVFDQGNKKIGFAIAKKNNSQVGLREILIIILLFLGAICIGGVVVFIFRKKALKENLLIS
jgi:hypothetical protein